MPAPFIIGKYVVTALLVVAVSELAKRNDRFGALVGALPFVTLLTILWLYLEQQPAEKIANHVSYTFWYVLPTLPMLLVFPLVQARFGFWIAVGSYILVTALLFRCLKLVLGHWGVLL